MFQLPQCCPPTLCNEDCIKNKKKCTVDPPMECVWGYKLGDVVTDLMIKPVQTKQLDNTGVKNFFECYE